MKLCCVQAAVSVRAVQVCVQLNVRAVRVCVQSECVCSHEAWKLKGQLNHPPRMNGYSPAGLDRAEAAGFYVTREIELINPNCSKMAT